MDSSDLSKNTIEDIEDQELYEHYSSVVDKGQSLLRIDKYLSSRIENISRSRIQNAAEAGCICVNGKPVKSNYRVKGGDVVSVVLPYPKREIELIPENIDLDIVYEDDDIMIINKPAGLVVHPGYGNYSGTMVNGLIYHLNKGNRAEAMPYLIHRIDKNTSGLLVVAKNEMSQIFLAKQFYEHTIERNYIALVWGDLTNDAGMIDNYIGRDIRNRKMMSVLDNGTGKRAITHYNVIERFTYVTLINCRLETGRTHQIRVHMKHIGHPIFNDDTYGGNFVLKGTTFAKYKQFVDNCFKICPRQALHAMSLGFIHPVTNKKMYFEVDFPDDMKQLIEKWRNYAIQYI